jgi:hypothetical protein
VDHYFAAKDDKVVPPEDLYLHELYDLDLDDPEAVRDFLNTFGDVDAKDYESEFYHGIVDRGANMVEEIGMAGSFLPYVTERLRVVRDVTRLSLALTGDGSVEAALASRESSALRDYEAYNMDRQGSDDPRSLSIAIVREVLDRALEPFHVTVAFGDSPDIWADDPDLFQVLCLALANDIADDADFKHCANETCGRVFLRHRGRAAQGKYHMSGVKYCSVECARAQKQREYRRRNKREASNQ